MAGDSHSEHERAHDTSGQDQHLDESEYVERYLQDYSAHKQHNKESEHEQHPHRADHDYQQDHTEYVERYLQDFSNHAKTGEKK